MRSKRGITLVSLVVTIIVLIILAGVSINLILGENGIITMAKKARENMELAKVDEESQLNSLYQQIVAEGGVSGNISNEEISQLAEFKRKIASALTDMGIDTLEITSTNAITTVPEGAKEILLLGRTPYYSCSNIIPGRSVLTTAMGWEGNGIYIDGGKIAGAKQDGKDTMTSAYVDVYYR